MDYFILFSKNKMFWTTGLAWIIAQTLKVVIDVFREKRFNFRWLVSTGGFPSSHSAGVSCLAASIGMTYGVDSPIFAVVLVFTIIVVFDAQGMRRWIGKQAGILNKMLDDIYWRKKMDETRLRELVGHTPIEVFSGVVLGIIVAVLCYQ